MTRSGSRVAFYDPYLDILGGGEKYILTILEQVAASGRHRVSIMSPNRPEPVSWRRLNISVEPGQLVWRRANQLSATALSAGSDLFVALTNHFPPLSLARRSAMIVQFPFAGRTDGHRLLAPIRAVDRGLRVRSYDTVVCYSQFVAGAVRERLGVEDPIVIAPPVDIPTDSPLARKEDMVVAVGRFFPAADANNKKHDVLIDSWRRVEQSSEAEGWTLHLAGGVFSDVASRRYLEQLRRRADGLAVQFHPNAPREELTDLYARGAIFWHAAGYGESQPERLEHFGITTLEAMAYGCVPVVVALGGQLEIVTDGENGRLWSSRDELAAVTRELMADPGQRSRLAARAGASARRFGRQEFAHAVREKILAPAGIEI